MPSATDSLCLEKIPPSRKRAPCPCPAVQERGKAAGSTTSAGWYKPLQRRASGVPLRWGGQTQMEQKSGTKCKGCPPFAKATGGRVFGASLKRRARVLNKRVEQQGQVRVPLLKHTQIDRDSTDWHQSSRSSGYTESLGLVLFLYR